jgi:hypothetical protein
VTVKGSLPLQEVAQSGMQRIESNSQTGAATPNKKCNGHPFRPSEGRLHLKMEGMVIAEGRVTPMLESSLYKEDWTAPSKKED